ncbi:MAG: OmpA family protein [Lutibacter sp.]|uniref:OmpA family protein n=1 Tax=Lutibacter sp. TaxID=1925666 RepID=UPI00299CF974|nr:OmpA family protein [Lutibacter sp.]MDX1830007.1 OmpA family protein [Lutibacter sp.]
MKNIYYILFILAISTQVANSQNLNRANHLFEDRAYMDAAELYANESPKTQEIYQKLGDCYYFNSDMKIAAKWYKFLLTEYNNTVSPQYYYRYAQTLKGIKKYDEADEWFQKYKEQLHQTPEVIKTLSTLKNEKEQLKNNYVVHKIKGNTSFSDFGTSFYGDKIVFASASKKGNLYAWNNEPYLDLYIANKDENGNLSNIEPLSKNINSKMHEANAVFTKDGKTMYFTRNNYLNGKKGKDAQKINHLKIYKAELVNDQWTNITELPFNNVNYSVEHPALNSAENKLYFASDMPGSIGSLDLFEVDINKDGTFGTPKNLGPKINTIYREQFPFISKNNDLYFSSDRPLGYGGLDIFKSSLVNNQFTTPINLGTPINSNLDDFSFIINDKNKGYFSSNRNGGVGDDDIYAFIQNQKYFVNGLVKDKTSMKLLPETEVSLLNNNGKLLKKVVVDNQASYNFEVENGKSYLIKATKNLYVPFQTEFQVTNNIATNKLPILMESFEQAEKNIIAENNKIQIKIKPIYFDFDKWNIRKDAALELNNVVTILNKYPSMKIEVGAHTDFRGSADYNLMLSEKRAKSVKKYLVSQGINSDRVTSAGYGETQPINNCTKPGSCNEEGYDKNRRCEFVILH